MKVNARMSLIEELFEQFPEEQRCPYIRRDDEGRPYCGKDFTEDQRVSETRRNVCDIYSLQLWCLDRERAPICIYYQGEPLD